MSESKKQTYLSTIAIIISILSLLTTICMAINEYKEKIEVFVEDLSVSSIENGVAKCEITVIVANTSHSTTSLLDTKVYAESAGFKVSELLENADISDLPITILQGGAERVTVTCNYPLDIESKSALTSGEQISVVLKNQWISIRFYSAKNKLYSGNARFENVK